jgi:hypothetical protein
MTADELERATGWVIKPEGACKGEVCKPLPDGVVSNGRVDTHLFAESLSMPLIHDAKHGLFCLGPESGGRALASAVAPDLELPDLSGDLFNLASLRGQKVLLVAWASW